MDPFDSNVCCSSRFIVLSDRGSVAVRARTVVPLGSEWSPTERRRRATGLDEARDGDGQAAGPLGRQRQHQFVLSLERLEGDLNRVLVLIDRDGDVTGHEVRFVLRLEGQVVREMVRSSQLADYLGEPFGERRELQLLALHDHESTSLARLQEKESIADLAAHADHHLVGVGEDVVHEGARSFKESVLLTLSTMGVEFVKPMALIVNNTDS